jgi:hypothetical protein
MRKIGRRSKIGFRRRSVWKRGDGIIVVLALYASKPWNRCITSLFIVAIPLFFGKILRHGSTVRNKPRHGVDRRLRVCVSAFVSMAVASVSSVCA